MIKSYEQKTKNKQNWVWEYKNDREFPSKNIKKNNTKQKKLYIPLKSKPQAASTSRKRKETKQTRKKCSSRQYSYIKRKMRSAYIWMFF